MIISQVYSQEALDSDRDRVSGVLSYCSDSDLDRVSGVLS